MSSLAEQWGDILKSMHGGTHAQKDAALEQMVYAFKRQIQEELPGFNELREILNTLDFKRKDGVLDLPRTNIREWLAYNNEHISELLQSLYTSHVLPTPSAEPTFVLSARRAVIDEEAALRVQVDALRAKLEATDAAAVAEENELRAQLYVARVDGRAMKAQLEATDEAAAAAVVNEHALRAQLEASDIAALANVDALKAELRVMKTAAAVAKSEGACGKCAVQFTEPTYSIRI